MNRKIKQREAFRPFAPSVLAERAAEYFEMPSSANTAEVTPKALQIDDDSPYMLFTYPVQVSKRCNVDPPLDESPSEAKVQTGGIDESGWHNRLAQVRSVVPAVTHLDYSARVQTVSRERFPKFHALLSAFEELTGCPMLINTSFNIRGEPPVGNAAEAYRCFLATDMDVLVVEEYVFLREHQPASARLASLSHLTSQEAD